MRHAAAKLGAHLKEHPETQRAIKEVTDWDLSADQDIRAYAENQIAIAEGLGLDEKAADRGKR
ncbi:hypothetical protein [Paractinoplanes bogorensis]|uniref:hypothetical protein n=1 Tax=Paractinoplanes bogorensis TaxID=1610840 RepID=UPI001C043741|nr:hypothetical protein [Actinoplanes bogorensis]